MSSDFRDLIRTDIERIPLPPTGEWTRRRRPATRPRTRPIVAALLGTLVIAAALTGGQLIRAVRDRIEADHAVAGVGLVPGDDLVYLADGDIADQHVQVVGMPKGERLDRFAAQTYVGRAEDGSFIALEGNSAYLPAASAGGTSLDIYETHLLQIDLRQGAAVGRIETGTVQLPRALQAALPGTPAFPAATAISADGQTIWLVADSGDYGETATLSRFEVGATTSVPARTLPLPPARLPSAGTWRSRIVALGDSNAAIIRDHYLPNGPRDSADWYIVDAQLRVVALFAADDAHRLPLSGRCADVQPDKSSTGWAVLCSDPSGTASGAVVFLDGRTFEIEATVSLNRQYGFALGMTASLDGRITVLTDRPVVIRIDALTRTLIDARVVMQRQSWFDHLLPSVAMAKSPGGPSAVFSPDAHYAYLAATPDAWWGPLSTIDLVAATVIATNKRIGVVVGLGLSSGGERLYALTSDVRGGRSLALLVPETLRVVSSTPTPQDSAFAIVAVRPSRR